MKTFFRYVIHLGKMTMHKYKGNINTPSLFLASTVCRDLRLKVPRKTMQRLQRLPTTNLYSTTLILLGCSYRNLQSPLTAARSRSSFNVPILQPMNTKQWAVTECLTMEHFILALHGTMPLSYGGVTCWNFKEY